MDITDFKCMLKELDSAYSREEVEELAVKFRTELEIFIDYCRAKFDKEEA